MPMSSVPLWQVALVALGGASFSLMGIAYRLGQGRGIRPEPIAAVLGICGVAMFLARSVGGLGSLPGSVATLALVVGFTQYLLIKIMHAALRLGTLAPMWCAVSLAFMPAVVAAGWLYDEHLSALQAAGVACVVACVACAAMTQRSRAADAPTVRHRGLLYGVVLAAILVVNCLPPFATKHLGMNLAADGRTIMDVYGAGYFFYFYLAFTVSLWVDTLIWHRRGLAWRRVVGLGLLAGAGSLGGISVWAVCASLPAAILFPVNAVAGILTAAIVSALAFGEGRSLYWYAMIGAGVTAAVLLNVQGVAAGG